MNPASTEVLQLVEFDPQRHMIEAQRLTHEAIAPFRERVEEIKSYVGVDLREAARIRTETELPNGLGVELASGEMQLPPDAKTCEKLTILRPVGQERVRANAAEIGLGRNRDITLTDVGMSKETQINVEGGRIFSKLRSEIELALEEGEGRVVLTLTKNRNLDNADRANTRENLNLRGTEAVASVEGDGRAANAFARRGEAVYRHIETLHCLGVELPGFAESNDQQPLTGNGLAVRNILERLNIDAAGLKTEYDGGVVEIMSHPDFIASYDPITKGHLGIDGMPKANVFESEVAGSLVMIGTIRGREIYIQDVPQELLFQDGEPVLDDRQQQKFSQPNAGQILSGTATLLGSQEAAVVTSNSYYPSRLAQVMVDATYLNALDLGSPTRRFGVIAYSPDRLARNQRTDPANVVMSMAHLLGEIKMADLALEAIDERFQRDLELAV